MAYTLDTTLGDILDDPQAREVLDKHLPGVADNPMVGMARGMSLNTILSMPQAEQLGLTRERAQTVLDELNERTGQSG